MKNTIESNLYGARFDFYNQAILFSGGIFSQEASCEIVYDKLGVTLNSVDQGVMLQKAKLFGDQKAYDAILASDNALEQKDIGESIENFDPRAWGKVFLEYVIDINFEKFKQNGAWRELLLITNNFEIVNATPEDLIWGIGIGVDDPLVLDKSNWKGNNLLGKSLMSARALLVEELSLIETTFESTEIDESTIDIPTVETIDATPYTGEEDEVTEEELATFRKKTQELLEKNS